MGLILANTITGGNIMTWDTTITQANTLTSVFSVTEQKKEYRFLGVGWQASYVGVVNWPRHTDVALVTWLTAAWRKLGWRNIWQFLHINHSWRKYSLILSAANEYYQHFIKNSRKVNFDEQDIWKKVPVHTVAVGRCRGVYPTSCTGTRLT